MADFLSTQRANLYDTIESGKMGHEKEKRMKKGEEEEKKKK